MFMMGAREKLSRLGKSLENSLFEQPNHLFEAWPWEKHGPYEEGRTLRISVHFPFAVLSYHCSSVGEVQVGGRGWRLWRLCVEP